MRDPATAYKAVEFFKTEFELDYLTSTLKKPYIAILDGITMGGGVGLCIHAPFRVATEKTLFAMPETKIGYFPDVGASFFLSRLDGELGTYLALTGNNLKGRDVFRLGLATHYIPSRRVPDLLERLASLEKAKVYSINTAIEEFSQELHSEEPPIVLKGEVRKVLDDAFGHDTVPQIFAALETAKKRGGPAAEWASATLRDLHMRSPTSLAVALKALRLGKTARRLEQVFATELLIATAYCNGASRDFEIGVTAKLEQPKVPDDVRVEWQPSTIQDIKPVTIQASFFDRNSPFFGGDKQPTLDIAVPEETPPSFLRFSLPSEYYVESVVKGTDSKSTPLALTREEVMNEVLKTFNWKHGVREKVDEILDRKTQVLNDPDNVGCLGWVSS
ncbi:3-hydroxyisobutyryl-coenzyme A hydrolase [Auriculariales sp. MPI-PUGE-AT-0066]|nr:3-hydroxyisobutyryl-coenzyme A hydrolase [Auriculariales sp. MPI-PUGE-AT-0066]